MRAEIRMILAGCLLGLAIILVAGCGGAALAPAGTNTPPTTDTTTTPPTDTTTTPPTDTTTPPPTDTTTTLPTDTTTTPPASTGTGTVSIKIKWPPYKPSGS